MMSARANMPFFLFFLMALILLSVYDLFLALHLIIEAKSWQERTLLIIMVGACLTYLWLITSWERIPYFYDSIIICWLPVTRLVFTVTKKQESFKNETRLLWLISTVALLDFLWWCGGVRSFNTY
jgi:hypothetical protein